MSDLCRLRFAGRETLSISEDGEYSGLPDDMCQAMQFMVNKELPYYTPDIVGAIIEILTKYWPLEVIWRVPSPPYNPKVIY